jgi:hypothetical protein
MQNSTECNCAVSRSYKVLSSYTVPMSVEEGDLSEGSFHSCTEIEIGESKIYGPHNKKFENFKGFGYIKVDKLRNCKFRINIFQENFVVPEGPTPTLKPIVEPLEPKLRQTVYKNQFSVNFATKTTYVPVNWEGPILPLEEISYTEFDTSLSHRHRRLLKLRTAYQPVVAGGCRTYRSKSYFEDLDEYLEETESPVNWTALGLIGKVHDRPVIGYQSVEYTLSCIPDYPPKVSRIPVAERRGIIEQPITIKIVDRTQHKIKPGSLLGKRALPRTFVYSYDP